MKVAGRRRYGTLNNPKQLILLWAYLGMDGISCGLVRGDFREGGNGGVCGVKEAVPPVQPRCRGFKQHSAVAEGLCINRPAIVHVGGVGALRTIWPLGIRAERLIHMDFLEQLEEGGWEESLQRNLEGWWPGAEPPYNNSPATYP